MRVRALLATAVCLLACTGGSEPADPGRLLITGSEGEVETADPESGEREVLAEARLHQVPVQPTASRDGRIVVWTGVDGGGDPVIRVDDGGSRRDIEVPIFPYFYSFDSASSTVAALGNHPDGENVALLLAGVDSQQAEIVDSDRPYYLDWHPRDSSLVVHAGSGELALLGDGGGRTSIAVQLGVFQAPAWTEDGRVVAPVRTESATVSLQHLQASTDELALIEPGDGSHAELAAVGEQVVFDVAGDRVAYVEGGAGPLRVVGLDGGSDVKVTSGTVVAFEWDPTGELLLYHVVEEEVGLAPHVWDGEEEVEYPSFAPTSVFVTQYLPFWSQYVRSVTQWAPDGSAFAYAAGSDSPTVWVQPLEGERREMGPGVMVTWAP